MAEDDHYNNLTGSQTKSTMNLTTKSTKTLSLTSLTTKYYSLTICQLTLIIIEVILALSIIFIIELDYDSMKSLACINNYNNDDISVVENLISDAEDYHEDYNLNYKQTNSTNENICMKHLKKRIIIETADNDNVNNHHHQSSTILKRKYLILILKIILLIIIIVSILLRLLTLAIFELNNVDNVNYYYSMINMAISSNAITTNGLLYFATTLFETILIILILTTSNSNSTFDYRL